MQGLRGFGPVNVVRVLDHFGVQIVYVFDGETCRFRGMELDPKTVDFGGYFLVVPVCPQVGCWGPVLTGFKAPLCSRPSGAISCTCLMGSPSGNGVLGRFVHLKWTIFLVGP